MKSISKEDAKRKWCPFARSLNSLLDTAGSANRQLSNGGPDSDCLCLTDGCMCWVDVGGDAGHCGLVNK
jgi:hypothetical protein